MTHYQTIVKFLTSLCLLVTVPAFSQSAEEIIAASVCGAWKPGTGLTVNGSRRIGWIHSVESGIHILHLSAGQVYLFNKPTNVFNQLPGTGPFKTISYHQLRIEAPEDAVLEWTLPSGKREPVPVIFLYPKG